MNRWGTRNQEEETPNFKELFNIHTHAVDLLTLPNFLQDAKSHSTPFTVALTSPKNLHFLLEIIEIAINPQKISTTNSKTLNNKITHSAIEIIGNLSEEFIDLVFQGEENNQDEVVQTQRDFPILSAILRIASEGQLQSTSLAYFSKIVTPFIYQKPAEMISFFSEQGLPLLLRYFWSSEMCDLATKVLQAQTQKNFFLSEKAQFVRKLIREIENYEETNNLEQTIQSLPSFMYSLVDKHQDKYERSKYTKLLTKILEDYQIFLFFISHLDKYKTRSIIKSALLLSLQAYLKIHLLPSVNSKGDDQQPSDPLQLNTNFSQVLQKYLSTHSVNEFVSDIKMQLVNYYKVLKLFLTISPSSVDSIVTVQFLRETLKIMKSEQNNNILHNLQRQVILKSFHSAKVHKLLKQEIVLLNELKIYLTQTNCKSSYATQIFLISQAILKHQQSINQSTQWSALSQRITNKRNFLAKPIANKDNQDEDNWDNFESEIIIRSDNVTDYTSKLTSLLKPRPKNKQNFTMVTQLDEIEGTEVLSEEEEEGFNDPSKTNHFYDDLGMPELPLDSDRSEEELNTNSLQTIPQNVKQNSTINVNIPGEQDFPETLNEHSHDQSEQHQIDDSELPETLGTDQAKPKQSNLENDEFPQTLGENSNKKIYSQQEEKTPAQIYLQNLGPRVEEFQFKPASSQLMQPKQELNLEGFNQLTVSINIAEEIVSEAKQKTRFKQEIEVLLLAKYKLELEESKK